MRRKILVRGPTLSTSGYGINARFVLRALREFEHLFDIYIMNINWGRTGYLWEDTIERKWIDQRIQETYHYVHNGGQFDMSIQVTIPGEWEKLAPVNIGVTAGTETTHISPQWMQKSNEVVDRIVVVSEHAKYAFENTKLQVRNEKDEVVGMMKCGTPIEVVNYPVEPTLLAKSYDDLDYSKLKLTTDFNFLVVAQWSPRKNLENTICWWVEEFFDNENVGLVVKTNLSNNSNIDRTYTEEKLKGLLKQYEGRKCKVYFLHGDMNDKELSELYTHPQIKCFVSLSHAEGFGLPAFESASNKLPVLAVDWSGHLDFLYKRGEAPPQQLFAAVDYDLAPIADHHVWEGVLERGSQWSFPKPGSYKMTLRKVYKEYEKYVEKAEELAEWVNVEFEQQKMYRKFVESLGISVEEKTEDIVEFD